MSITDSISILFTKDLSRHKIPKLDNLSCPIVERMYVFSLLRHEKDLSAEQDVAGIVASI